MIYPAPITVYTGVNGSGKTLSAVAVAARASGGRSPRRVVSNIPGLVVGEKFQTIAELSSMDLRFADVIIDEAGVLLSSTDRHIDADFIALVQQLRKDDTRLLMTVPSFARTAKLVREVTLLVVQCRPMLAVRNPGRVWRSNRLIYQLAWDAQQFDAAGMAIPKRARIAGRGFLRSAKYFDLFDSFARVGVGNDRGLSG